MNTYRISCIAHFNQKAFQFHYKKYKKIDKNDESIFLNLGNLAKIFLLNFYTKSTYEKKLNKYNIAKAVNDMFVKFDIKYKLFHQLPLITLKDPF